MFKMQNTGLEDLDSQHRLLVATINQLIDGSKDQLNLSQELRSAVQFLQFYLQTHLAYEEQGMIFYSYPDIDRHRKEHEFFVSELNSIIYKIETDSPFAATKLLVLLKDWLLNHIEQSDSKYAQFVLSKRNRAAY